MKATKIVMLLIVIVSLVALVNEGFSATVATWFGCQTDPNQPTDANGQKCVAGTGFWRQPYWNKEGVNIPPPPSISSDEIKITRLRTVCTIDSDVGNYLCKLSIAGGGSEANAPRLEIIDGGQIGIGEFRVGCGGTTASGPVGCVRQTGGTVKLADNLIIGRYGTSSRNPNEGKGLYTISGGSIICDAANTKGALYIAKGDTVGKLVIIGNKANIEVKKLYIAGDGYAGKAILEFKIGQEGASPIKVAEDVTIDAGGEISKTHLVITAIGEPPKSDIVLIENQSSSPVNGIFDTVNGKPAMEDADVVLTFGENNYNYKLTYKGGMGNNDVILRYISSQPSVKDSNSQQSVAPEN